jgi:hypothetical protein
MLRTSFKWRMDSQRYDLRREAPTIWGLDPFRITGRTCLKSLPRITVFPPDGRSDRPIISHWLLSSAFTLSLYRRCLVPNYESYLLQQLDSTTLFREAPTTTLFKSEVSWNTSGPSSRLTLWPLRLHYGFSYLCDINGPLLDRVEVKWYYFHPFHLLYSYLQV